MTFLPQLANRIRSYRSERELRRLEDEFGVGRAGAQDILSGKAALGTFFVRQYVGFSDESWPVIIVGKFKPIPNDDGSFGYDLGVFWKRVVIDCSLRQLSVESTFRASGRPRVLSTVKDIVSLEAMAGIRVDQRMGIRFHCTTGGTSPGIVPEAESPLPCFQRALRRLRGVLVGPMSSRSVALQFESSLPVLKAIAARLNYLWQHAGPRKSVDSHRQAPQ